MNNPCDSKLTDSYVSQSICAPWLALLLLLSLPAAVQAQFNYVITNGTVTITGYTGPSGAVTIPGTINGLPVTSIGYEAFYNGGYPLPYDLTSITIPDSVTDIGANAFAWCTGLKSATLGNGLMSIGVGAFSGCGLSTITIPSGVASIGDYAFGGCWQLTGVYFLGNAPSLGGPSVFGGDNNIVYYLSGTTGWGPTFGGRPTALWSPQQLWLYTTNSGTISITKYTGSGGAVTIPGTINGLPVTSLGDKVFWNCTSVSSVTIPDSVTTIATEAFYGCSSLTSVTIPDSVTSIGQFAFSGCGLITITIPPSVTLIDAWTFAGCSSLTSVTIPNGVTSIAAWAFQYCTSLTNVTIPTSVTGIDGMSFYSCTSLTAITVDPLNPAYSSVAGVLFDKSQTTLLQYPEGKTGAYTIPDGVITIAYEAFDTCENLTGVTVPSSVTSIGGQTFYWCTGLTGAYFKGNSPEVASLVFTGDDNATVYYLPGTTGWGATFGGLPTAVWSQVPTIQKQPQTQTAEVGSAVGFRVWASSPLPLFYFWYLDATNLLGYGTNWQVELPEAQFDQAGSYTVVISNVLGTITSAPALLKVIAPVERRPVPGVKVTGATGSLLNVDYADSLTATALWTTLGSVSLSSTSQYYFDLTLPLPPQRFYRAWQTGTPGVMPSLALHLVPALTLTGTIGGSVRVDYINRFGPTDAWVTLATVQLTNTSQLYFDTSSIGQPARLYRVVQMP